MILVPLTTVIAPLLAAGPALAGGRGDRNDLVVLTGRAVVAEGEVVDTVVVFDGEATVEGTVEGAVVAFNAPVTISGRVGEDVVAFNGIVTVESGGQVGGDIVSRKEPVVDEGATVGGEIRRDPAGLFREPFPFFGRLIAWVAVSISTLVLGLILLGVSPRAADAVEVAFRTATGATAGWGLLALVGLPLLGILALITLVGIPFGFGLLMALFLIYALGYTSAAWLLGRRLVKAPASRLVGFLAGLAILRLVALIPIVAGIVAALAVVFGLGALIVAIWRGRRVASATA
jgi:cytoskeletal protein CcmA (bactofilin family)